MKMIYQEDQITIDPSRITTGTHPYYGDTTIFHDVVIASEMVQKYQDGTALKQRDELEAYVKTMDFSCPVVIGGHPEAGIVSDIADIAGRTFNPRHVKDLKDPKTKRPNRAGIRTDIEIFNEKVPPELLKDMKNGKKQDVSIGFFFSKDETPGEFNGVTYDYVQRNMFHNHLTAGIDNGRCPSEYCGLGADEITQMLAVDPFAGFKDFDACVAQMKKENPDLSDEGAKKICGSLKEKHEDNLTEEDDLVKYASKILRTVMEISDEIAALRGERDALKENLEKTPEIWWKSIDWKVEDMKTVFDHLTEDVRNLIIEDGLCPECTDESEEECEEGYTWSEEEEKCVPVKEEDVLESNPGFSPGKAEEECPEGMEWNAERKQCVAIEDFSPKKDSKKDPYEVLKRSRELTG